MAKRAIAIALGAGLLTACQAVNGGGVSTRMAATAPSMAPANALRHTWIDHIVLKNQQNGLNLCAFKFQFLIEDNGRKIAAQVFYMVPSQVELPTLAVRAMLFDFPVQQVQRFHQIDAVDVITTAGNGPRETILATLQERLQIVHPENGAEGGIIGSFDEIIRKGTTVTLLAEGRQFSFPLAPLPKSQFKGVLDCVKQRVHNVNPAIFRKMVDERRAQERKPADEVKSHASYPVIPQLLESLVLSPLDADQRRKYGFSDTVKGLIVTGVLPSSGENPIREGDVIEAVNGIPVRVPADIEALVAKAKASPRGELRLNVACKERKCPAFM